MSYTAAQVAWLAGTIYTGINSPSSQSVGYISGWLVDPTNLGELSIRLNVDVSPTGGCITGDFGAAEATIYGLMYKTQYYESKALQVLLSADSSIAWVSLADGDAKVSRANPVDVSKAFGDLRESAQKTLYVSINNYKRDKSLVLNVDSSSLYSYPSP